MKVVTLLMSLFFSVNGFAAAPVDGPNFRCKEGIVLDFSHHESVNAWASILFPSGKSERVIFTADNLTSGKMIDSKGTRIGAYKVFDDRMVLEFIEGGELVCKKAK